jgi:hypothetical protein
MGDVNWVAGRSAVGAVHLLGNKVDHVVVEVAECPTFAGFERLHDTMSDVVEVPRGVLVRGVVAAADVTALHAQSQVDPLPADLEAVFAPFDGARFDRFDVGQVYARHRESLSHVRRTVNSRRRPYRSLCTSWSGELGTSCCWAWDALAATQMVRRRTTTAIAAAALRGPNTTATSRGFRWGAGEAGIRFRSTSALRAVVSCPRIRPPNS